MNTLDASGRPVHADRHRRLPRRRHAQGARPGRRGQPVPHPDLPGRRDPSPGRLACARRSPSARSASALASSGPTRSTARRWTGSRSSPAATSAAPSSTTCAISAARRPRSRSFARSRPTDRRLAARRPRPVGRGRRSIQGISGTRIRRRPSLPSRRACRPVVPVVPSCLSSRRACRPGVPVVPASLRSGAAHRRQDRDIRETRAVLASVIATAVGSGLPIVPRDDRGRTGVAILPTRRSTELAKI